MQNYAIIKQIYAGIMQNFRKHHANITQELRTLCKNYAGITLNHAKYANTMVCTLRKLRKLEKLHKLCTNYAPNCHGLQVQRSSLEFSNTYSDSTQSLLRAQKNTTQNISSTFQVTINATSSINSRLKFAKVTQRLACTKLKQTTRSES